MLRRSLPLTILGIHSSLDHVDIELRARKRLKKTGDQPTFLEFRSSFNLAVIELSVSLEKPPVPFGGFGTSRLEIRMHGHAEEMPSVVYGLHC